MACRIDSMREMALEAETTKTKKAAWVSLGGFSTATMTRQLLRRSPPIGLAVLAVERPRSVELHLHVHPPVDCTSIRRMSFVLLFDDEAVKAKSPSARFRRRFTPTRLVSFP
jgi:hypothetical protein